jgi:hypothetical protein
VSSAELKTAQELAATVENEAAATTMALRVSEAGLAAAVEAKQAAEAIGTAEAMQRAELSGRLSAVLDIMHGQMEMGMVVQAANVAVGEEVARNAEAAATVAVRREAEVEATRIAEGMAAIAATREAEVIAANVLSRSPRSPQSPSLAALLLPAGWEQITEEDGTVYYFNAAKDLSAWTIPEDELREPEPELPKVLRSRHSEESTRRLLTPPVRKQKSQPRAHNDTLAPILLQGPANNQRAARLDERRTPIIGGTDFDSISDSGKEVLVESVVAKESAPSRTIESSVPETNAVRRSSTFFGESARLEADEQASKVAKVARRKAEVAALKTEKLQATRVAAATMAKREVATARAATEGKAEAKAERRAAKVVARKQAEGKTARAAAQTTAEKRTARKEARLYEEEADKVPKETAPRATRQQLQGSSAVERKIDEHVRTALWVEREVGRQTAEAAAVATLLDASPVLPSDTNLAGADWQDETTMTTSLNFEEYLAKEDSLDTKRRQKKPARGGASEREQPNGKKYSRRNGKDEARLMVSARSEAAQSERARNLQRQRSLCTKNPASLDAVSSRVYPRQKTSTAPKRPGTKIRGAPEDRAMAAARALAARVLADSEEQSQGRVKDSGRRPDAPWRHSQPSRETPANENLVEKETEAEATPAAVQAQEVTSLAPPAELREAAEAAKTMKLAEGAQATETEEMDEEAPEPALSAETAEIVETAGGLVALEVAKTEQTEQLEHFETEDAGHGSSGEQLGQDGPDKEETGAGGHEEEEGEGEDDDEEEKEEGEEEEEWQDEGGDSVYDEWPGWQHRRLELAGLAAPRLTKAERKRAAEKARLATGLRPVEQAALANRMSEWSQRREEKYAHRRKVQEEAEAAELSALTNERSRTSLKPAEWKATADRLAVQPSWKTAATTAAIPSPTVAPGLAMGAKAAWVERLYVQPTTSPPPFEATSQVSHLLALCFTPHMQSHRQRSQI